ncbi:hypothetical protein ACFW04_006768 [Cataglyphis niger]
MASLALFIIASFIGISEEVAVMSIDLGSEWMKVAIVSPGVPMEIALNKESKRKTPVAIAFRDGERSFGEDAQVVGVRFPQNTFSYILDLIGKPIDNPLVQLYLKRFPYYNIVADDQRKTIAFKLNENTTYTPEELLAQILHKGKEIAETSAQQKINEAVITVPGFFNQAERKALIQAAELAGLKVLQLINDYTAVALNYGVFGRTEINDSAHYIMFYDMGASSSTATIVSYQNMKTKERGFVETNPHVNVLGVGYDRTLGGLEMQIRLRNYLAKEFDALKKTPSSVFTSPRAMAKLFKEAGRVKTVLSANADHFAQIEGLIDDIDFKFQVTRDKLEEICADLFERITNPVKLALETSALTMDVISHVVLVGAGTRMPKVQETLSQYVKTELSKNVNTDEAAALGAAYKAADLSQGFKVKKFITKDAILFPIQITFDRYTDNKVRQVKKTLFGKMNPFPQKKIITFNKHTQDFDFHVNYAELDYLPPIEVIIHQLNVYDSEKVRRETALNNLESYVIDAQQKLDSEEYSVAATDKEIEEIQKACAEISEWLYEDGFTATAEVYEEKLMKLQKLTNDVYERVSEHRDRPEVLKGMISLLNGSKTFLENMRNLSSTTEIITPVEVETLERAINETQDYYETISKYFAKASLNEPVKYKVRHIINKMDLLDREIKYLVTKVKIWRPKQETVANQTIDSKTEENEENEEFMSNTENDKFTDEQTTSDNAKEQQEPMLKTMDATQDPLVLPESEEPRLSEEQVPEEIHQEL